MYNIVCAHIGMHVGLYQGTGEKEAQRLGFPSAMLGAGEQAHKE